MLIMAMVVITVVAASLFVTKYIITPKHILILKYLPPPSPLIPPISYNVSYGLLFCYGTYAIIPGNSMIMLYYHPHNYVKINNAIIFVAFPASIINKVINALQKLPNPRDSMIVGIYVNGRLIAVNNNSAPVLGLNVTVNRHNFWQSLNIKGELSWFVDYTEYSISFPVINLTPNDTIAVVIYSAIPYTLPSCGASNEAEVANLIMKNSYEDGRYITEEPVVYIIHVPGLIQGLPQELPTSGKPFITGIAPSYIMGLT